MTVAGIDRDTTVDGRRTVGLSFGIVRSRRARHSPGARSGTDEALIRSLYDEYGRMLLGYAYRLTGDRQRAEDVVQETLLRAWRHAEALTGDRGSVRGWLLTVARNVVVDMARASRIRPTEVVGSANDVAIARTSVPDQTTDVENAVVVERVLATLSPEYRAVLVEVYLHGRTAREASRALGIPVGTVKSRTYHALHALRARLTEIDEVTA
jgi:RNA polymerase sigma-70 factor, ECF subfamily